VIGPCGSIHSKNMTRETCPACVMIAFKQMAERFVALEEFKKHHDDCKDCWCEHPTIILG